MSGTTDRDVKVTIDGKLASLANGQFKEIFVLDKEGTYDLIVVAKSFNGPTTTVRKQITYKIGGPALKLNEIPDTVSKELLVVSGTVKDANDAFPDVYVNDEKMTIYSNGSFSYSLQLQQGNNPFTFTAANSSGKTATVAGSVYKQ